MAFDNFCSTRLSLSLCSNDKESDNNHHLIMKKNKAPKSFDLDHHHDQESLPSLTLGLSSSSAAIRQHHLKGENTVHGLQQQQAASNSAVMSIAVSSFSNGSSVKIERRDVGIEDIDNIDHINQDYEEEGPRKKLKLSKDQSLVLEESFKHHITLCPKEKQDLANMLNLRPRQVEVWFQNRRARTKLKQTEINTEVLKKCCESLKEENTRLHNELHDLKSSHFRVHLPAPSTATVLEMCSSCKRVGGATVTANGDENMSMIKSFSMGARSTYFYSPNYANPSAACW